MEKLLNKLIEKGWKPRGENVELHWTSKDTFWEEIVIFNGNAGWFKKWWCTYRELVSKESWLWQFCCRNKLVSWKPEWIKTCGWVVREEKKPNNSHYWIIESALIDKSELEKFLLDNIKVS